MVKGSRTLIVAIIPARGGSKGLPQKNLTECGGKPLIAWSIKHALDSHMIDEVYVTSDDQKILEIASNYGALTIQRPKELAADNSSSEDALVHALKEIRSRGVDVELVVFLQATSPLRDPSDLDKAIGKLKTDKLDSLLSVSPIDDFFVWVESSDGPVAVNHDPAVRKRRQELPTKYLENGSFYIFYAKQFLSKKNRLHGAIGMFPMEKHKTHQIDDQLDLRICNALLKEFGHCV